MRRVELALEAVVFNIAVLGSERYESD